MKKIIVLIISIITFTITAKAQFEGSKQVFESPKLKSQVAIHKIVAILPFDVKVTYRKQPKNFSLEKVNISEKLDQMTKDEIAKILGVDAVIGGRFETEQTKAGAIASPIVFGGLGGKTGSLTLTLNNGSSGDLLWRFFKTMDDNITSSTDDLVERMMRKVSRNFPYLNN